MEVIKLVMRQMPRYSDMYMRPYETNVLKDSTIKAMVVATAAGTAIDTSSISDISGRIVMPSTRVDGIGQIENGWDEQRFMYMMEVIVKKSKTSAVHMVISGYTDSSDVAEVNNRNRRLRLPGDLRFYFNSTYKVKTIQGEFGNVRRPVHATADASQILTRTKRMSLSKGSRGTISLRPEDVIINQSNDSLMLDGLDFDLDSDHEIKDMRPGFRQSLKLSDRGNTNSASWLTKTLVSMRDAEKEFVGDDRSTLQRARGYAREKILEVDPFWEELEKVSAIMDSGYVEWSELLEFNHDLDDIADVSIGEKTRGVDMRGYGSWSDSTNECLAATIIRDTVLGYMIDCMYVEANFFCTNDTRGGRVSVTPGKFLPFSKDMDVEDNMNSFIRLVERQLFNNLLFHNDMTISFSVKAHIHRDIEIGISIDGDEEERYICPSFADSIVSPVLTTREDLINDVSKDVRTLSRRLREHVEDERGNPARKRILLPGDDSFSLRDDGGRTQLSGGRKVKY